MIMRKKYCACCTVFGSVVSSLIGVGEKRGLEGFLEGFRSSLKASNPTKNPSKLLEGLYIFNFFLELSLII